MLYAKVLAENPDHINALNNSACVKDDLGNITGAYEDLNRAIQICPEYGDAYHSFGNLYEMREDYDSAIDNYTKAISLGYIKTDVLRNMGVCYERKNMFVEALKYHSETIELEPQRHDTNERIVLPLDNLHIGKTTRRHLEKYKELYELRYDSDFDAVMDNIFKHYYKMIPSIPAAGIQKHHPASYHESYRRS